MLPHQASELQGGIKMKPEPGLIPMLREVFTSAHTMVSPLTLPQSSSPSPPALSEATTASSFYCGQQISSYSPNAFGEEEGVKGRSAQGDSFQIRLVEQRQSERARPSPVYLYTRTCVFMSRLQLIQIETRFSPPFCFHENYLLPVFFRGLSVATFEAGLARRYYRDSGGPESRVLISQEALATGGM